METPEGKFLLTFYLTNERKKESQSNISFPRPEDVCHMEAPACKLPLGQCIFLKKFNGFGFSNLIVFNGEPRELNSMKLTLSSAIDVICSSLMLSV